MFEYSSYFDAVEIKKTAEKKTSSKCGFHGAVSGIDM